MDGRINTERNYLSKDVDSRQELGDDFPSFHFTHRNPIIDTILASEIAA